MAKQPSRADVRAVGCPTCGASPGHPCVEYRTTGHYGKHLGHVREANHAERIARFSNDAATEQPTKGD